MPRRPRSAFAIDRPAQLRALASPLRQELLDVVEADGPLAIAAIAERLGRAPDTLYFHVRRLARVGLLIEVAPQAAGRHTSAVYDVPGRPLQIDRQKARAADLQAVVDGILRLAGRDHRRGLGRADTVSTGPGRNHCGGRTRGWLDARSLRKANTLLAALTELLRQGRPGRNRQPIALAWVLAATPPTRRTRPVRSARSTKPKNQNRAAKPA